jgi:hypothetical protein
MTTTRPGLYPYHDVNGTNITWPEDSNFLFSGYIPGIPVPSADHNGKFNRAGFWHEYLDRDGIRNEDWLDPANAMLSLSTLTYDIGSNVLTTGATVSSRGVYLINLTRIETDAPFLNPVGGSVAGDPLIFPGATVPGRIWVYASSTGQVRYESVAPATADSPAGNEITLNGLDIDALGEVTDGAVVPVTLPLPPQGLSISSPIVTVPALIVSGELAVTLDAYFSQAVSITGGAYVGGNFQVDGNVLLGNAIGDTTTVAGPATFNSSATVTGTTTCNGNVVLGNAAGDTVTVGGTTTFNAPVTVASGQTLTCNGDVVLGNAAGDAIIVPGTVTFQSPVNVTDTVDFTGAASINSAFTVLGASGGSLTSDPTAVCTWNGRMLITGRMSLTAGSSIAAGDLSNDGSNNLRWRDASATKYVNVNASGWVLGYGLDSTEGPAATVTVQTGVQIAPLTAASLKVTGRAYVQRAVVGDAILSLVAVGDATIGATRAIAIPFTSGTNWYPVFLTRTYSANTTARHYQFVVDGNGQNVECAEMVIEITPAS